MNLFLIRHAHAIDGAEDAVRPLSQRGREQVRALAKFLGRSGALQPAEIWHSPLVRSRQTAELLVERLGLDATLREVPGLEPEADPAETAHRLKGRGRRLALVGHEPHLSALASLLVAGAAQPPRFVLKKCAVLALEGAGAQWRVCWHLAPALFE